MESWTQVRYNARDEYLHNLRIEAAKEMMGVEADELARATQEFPQACKYLSGVGRLRGLETAMTILEWCRIDWEELEMMGGKVVWLGGKG